MRPRSRDKKLQEEWATPLKSVDDINEVLSKFFNVIWIALFGLWMDLEKECTTMNRVLLLLISCNAYARDLWNSAWENWEAAHGRN